MHHSTVTRGLHGAHFNILQIKVFKGTEGEEEEEAKLT